MNNPFDRCFKDFVDQAPELFLLLLEMPSGRDGWTYQVLRSETSPPVLMPDFVRLETGPNGERSVVHLEFYLDYADRLPEKMARYGGSLIAQHDCEVRSVMVLIRPGGPAVIPERGEFARGRSMIVHPYRVVRLWEVSAAPILENESMRRLLALAPGLDCKWEDLRRVADAVMDSGKDEEISQFLLMLSLKYNKDKIDELIGRHRMGFGEVLWEGSSLLKEMREKAIQEGWNHGREKGLEQGREQGREQGIEQGRELGRASEARRLLRAVLGDRFPGLEAMPELELVDGVDHLESLMIDKVLRLSGRVEVERAIRAAAAKR